MVRWSAFEVEAPDLAARARELLYEHGLGLAYVATIRRDGGPRVHPFCPIIAEGGLWGFMNPSPKQADLERDGRCAIHSFPSDDIDDELYLQCRAHPERADDVAAAVRAAYHAPLQSDDELLFEFELERAMLATYVARPSWPPNYTIWIAS